MKVTITGQPGFVGSHLFNYLNLKEEIELIPFEDEYFLSDQKLREIVRQCDVIVHLAAMNRSDDPKLIYNTNIELVRKLIQSCESENVNPHILFSSSTQEERDNEYGLSKKEGRILLDQWAQKNGATFTGLVIPNVFGPFCLPFYNSVVATFSHQLIHGTKPEIHVDGLLKLIYVQELVEEIYKVITGTIDRNPYFVKHSTEIKVTGILEILRRFHHSYFESNIIPELKNEFEVQLFNTFRSYIDLEKHFPFKLTLHEDNRGHLVEIIKENTGGQSFYSVTKPGITRGNHFHTKKIERFCVVKGQGKILLRRIGTDKIIEMEVNGDHPATVDMPVWYTHNITNTGSEDMFTLFWSNEHFDPANPDTFFEKV